MAYRDYEHCPGCDGKALYMGYLDTPDGVVVWHQTCLDEARPNISWEDLSGVYRYAQEFDVDSDPLMQRIKALLASRMPSLVELDAGLRDEGSVCKGDEWDTEAELRAEDERQRMDDGLCNTCWGSGWLAQFITPCPDCKGTGQRNYPG